MPTVFGCSYQVTDQGGRGKTVAQFLLFLLLQTPCLCYHGEAAPVVRLLHVLRVKSALVQLDLLLLLPLGQPLQREGVRRGTAGQLHTSQGRAFFFN